MDYFIIQTWINIQRFIGLAWLQKQAAPKGIACFCDLMPNWRLAVVSEVERGASTRLTEGLAAARNQLVGRLAAHLVLAHAAPGGQLAHLSEQWLGAGRSLLVLG